MNVEPLNRALYDMLTQVSGSEPYISRQGEVFRYETVYDDFGIPRMKGCSGEQYAINCPDCGDTRRRLYFNYMFGLKVDDPLYPMPLTHLCYCQNEQMCKGDYWFKLLIAQISGPLIEIQVREQVKKTVTQDTVFGDLPTMGETMPLNQVPPDHRSIKYLQGRGYNIDYLTKSCQAALSISHPNSRIENNLKGRVIFPFYIHGKLECWQARLAYELPPGRSKHQLGKWYFPPGTKKSLWNHDTAIKYKIAIVSEGITSAINTGPAGVAIGGKSLTYNVRKALLEGWNYFLLFLDPDADGRPDKRGIPQKNKAEEMQRELEAEGKVVFVMQWPTPCKEDPGSLGPRGCYEMIKQQHPAVIQMLPYYNRRATC